MEGGGQQEQYIALTAQSTTSNPLSLDVPNGALFDASIDSQLPDDGGDPNHPSTHTQDRRDRSSRRRAPGKGAGSSGIQPHTRTADSDLLDQVISMQRELQLSQASHNVMMQRIIQLQSDLASARANSSSAQIVSTTPSEVHQHVHQHVNHDNDDPALVEKEMQAKLKKIHLEILEAMHSCQKELEKDVLRLHKVSGKLEEVLDDIKTYRKGDFPRGVDRKTIPAEFEYYDKPLADAEAGNYEIKIVIPHGASRREAVRIVNHLCCHTLRAIDVEALRAERHDKHASSTFEAFVETIDSIRISDPSAPVSSLGLGGENIHGYVTDAQVLARKTRDLHNQVLKNVDRRIRQEKASAAKKQKKEEETRKKRDAANVCNKLREVIRLEMSKLEPTEPMPVESDSEIADEDLHDGALEKRFLDRDKANAEARAQAKADKSIERTTRELLRPQPKSGDSSKNVQSPQEAGGQNPKKLTKKQRKSMAAKAKGKGAKGKAGKGKKDGGKSNASASKSKGKGGVSAENGKGRKSGGKKGGKN